VNARAGEGSGGNAGHQPPPSSFWISLVEVLEKKGRVRKEWIEERGGCRGCLPGGAPRRRRRVAVHGLRHPAAAGVLQEKRGGEMKGLGFKGSPSTGRAGHIFQRKERTTVGSASATKDGRDGPTADRPVLAHAGTNHGPERRPAG
jgi:hypothetical protein